MMAKCSAHPVTGIAQHSVSNTDCAKRIESRNFSYPVLRIVKHAKFGLVYLANTG